MSGLDSILADFRVKRPSMKQQTQSAFSNPSSQPLPEPSARRVEPPHPSAVLRDRSSVFPVSTGSLSSLSSLGVQQPTAAPASQAAFTDLLGGLSNSLPRTTMERGAPATAAAAARQQQTSAAPAESVPAAAEDPFDMFGGPPAPLTTASSSVHGGRAMQEIDDSFLAAFAPPVQQELRPKLSVTAASLDRLQPDGLGDLLDVRIADAARGADAGSRLQASSSPLPQPSTAGPPSTAVHVSGLAWDERQPTSTSAGRTSSFGYERRQPASGSSAQHYRVFDFVEAQPDSPTTSAAVHSGNRSSGNKPASTGSSSRPLEGGMHPGSRFDAQSWSSNDAYQRREAATGGMLQMEHLHPPRDTVVDLGHKAAKALQSGKKWFMRASKTLVMQVQQRLEQGSGDSSQGATGPGKPAPFHYDWAAQLVRISPNSRSAALGAMTEDDRLAVQRILDEAMLGEGITHPGFQQQGPVAHLMPASVKPQGSTRHTAVNVQHGLASSSSGQSLSACVTEDQQHPLPQAGQQPPRYEQLFGTGSSQVEQGTPAATVGADLLGVYGAAGPGKEQSSPAAVEEDLLCMGNSSAEAPVMGAAEVAAASSMAHINNLFSMPPSAAPTTKAAPSATKAAASSSAAAGARSGTSALDSMIDLQSELQAVDTGAFRELYKDAEQECGQAEAEEPEVRRALRQRRIQEKHERMMRQLAEKRARDEAEEAEKSGKVELRTMLKPKIDSWAAGKKDNIRALLASLHTVLWEGSGWTAPSMADMVDNHKVKRMYMKANLVVHPDKVKQKGGSLEQVATADMVFDVLKGAWARFESTSK